MDSEPEEGEIREGEKRRRGRNTGGGVSEDERPRGYRVGPIIRKRRSGLSLRSNSPKKSRQRSRDSPGRKNRKRRSVSTTQRDDSTSRNQGGGTRGPGSVSGSRRSRSRSPCSSGRLRNHRTSAYNESNSGGANTTLIKKLRKRGHDFSKRKSNIKNSSSKTKLLKHDSVGLAHEHETSPCVQNENIHDLSLTSISPTPLNGLSTLENVEDISEEEDVAVVSVIHASDRRPELILLDSTSSSDEEADNDKVLAREYEEEDLEELELRKKALEGLFRKLDPSDSNPETLLKEVTSCDNNKSDAAAVPEVQHQIHSPKNMMVTGTSTNQILLPSTPTEFVTQKSKELVPVVDNEKETELELCLLRAKLLSDLAKKSKSLPVSKALDCESPSSSSVAEKIIPIDLPKELSLVSYTDKSGTLLIPSVTRLLTSSPSSYPSLTENPTVSTGREHELPTSYSYAPMPVDPIQRQVTSYSVSVSNNNNARTVVSHTTIPTNNNNIPSIVSYPAICPAPPHQDKLRTNVVPISRPRTIVSHVAKPPLILDGQVRRVEVMDSTVTFNAKPRNGTTSSTSVNTNILDKRLLTAKNCQIHHKSIPLNGHLLNLQSPNDLFSIKRTVINPQANNNSRYNRTTVHRNTKVNVPRFPPPKKYKFVIPLRDCDTSSEEEDNNETDIEEQPSKISVPLGDAFHSSLDNFLKTVRESASQNQALAAISTAALPSTSLSLGNSKTLNPVDSVAQVEGTIVSSGNAQTTGIDKNENVTLDPAALRSIKKTINTQKSKQKQSQRIVRQLGTKDEDIFDMTSPAPTASESNEHPTNGLKSNVATEVALLVPETSVIKSDTIESTASPANLNASKISRTSVLTSAENVTSKQTSPSNDVNHDFSASKTPDKSSVLRDSEQMPWPSVVSENTIPSKVVVSIERGRVDISGPTIAGRTSPVVPKITNGAQTREELQLREKLLRITLLKSERKLKLTNTEKELIDTRFAATELMGKLLDKVVKYSEKEKQCSDMEKQVLRIKRQLEMVEKNLLAAKKETTTLQEDFMKSAEQAFGMRKKSIELGKTCRVIGKQIIGDEYRVPSNGSEEMLKKVKEIHKHSTMVKKLKAGSSELNEIEKQFQAALNNPMSGRNSKSSSAPGTATAPNMSVIHGVGRQEHALSQVSSDEESWNAFKSQGLTKCLRTASKNQECGLEKVSQRPISKKIRDVMQARPIPLGIYVPYDSPVSFMGYNLRIQIQSLVEPICGDSITSTCQKSHCKLQHLLR